MKELKSGVISTSKDNHYVISAPAEAKYFSEVFHAFPHGIINKTETGVGATTMELYSKRNSIIVEPLRVTASLKQEKTPGSFYVGSPIKKSQKRVFTSDIANYLNVPESLGGYKKIICTIDSLPKVMNSLPDDFKDNFFLLIDESDAVQQDSSFRENMNVAMDIYKSLKQENRALLTATPIEFTDPELKDERRVTINWSIKPSTKIIHLETNNPYGNIADLALELFEKSSEIEKAGGEFEPIVIAINNVGYSLELANFLSRKGVKKEDIAILCSERSKRKAGPFWTTLDSDKLPKKVVIKTSAYYTGFDIDQAYHLIMISDNSDILNMPSIGGIKQIMGRCRKELISCHLVQNFKEIEPRPNRTYENLIEEAKEKMKMLECMKRHITKGSIFDYKVDSIIGGAVEKLEIYGYPLIRMHKDEEEITFSINHIGIDGILDFQNTKDTLYSSKNQLVEKLDDLDLLEEPRKTSSKSEVVGGRSTARFATVGDMVSDAIFNLRYRFQEMHEFEGDYNHEATEIVFSIIKDFGNKYDPDQLLELIDEYHSTKQGLKGLRRLYFCLYVYSQGDETSFKKQVQAQFPVGSSFREEVVMSKLNLIEMSAPFLKELFPFLNFNKGWLDYISENKRIPNVGPITDRHTRFDIISHNPFGFELKRRRKFCSRFGIAK
jgi:hypothetical protein